MLDSVRGDVVDCAWMRKERVLQAGKCYHLVSRVAHRACSFDDEGSGRGAIHQLPAAPKHGARGDTGARIDIWSELPRRDVAIMSTALRCRQVRFGPAPTTNSVAPCLRHLAAAWGTPSGLWPSASATSLRSLSV